VRTLLVGTLAAARHPILPCGRAPLAATKIHDTAPAAGWLSALGLGQCLLAAQNGAGRRDPSRATLIDKEECSM
jgi:hypothetical protein